MPESWSARRPASTRRGGHRSSASADLRREAPTRRRRPSGRAGSACASVSNERSERMLGSEQAVSSSAVARRYFGTDGVRGVVGEGLTSELVERLGRATTVWSGRGRVFVGRDTRASGPELEEAFARGVVAVGGN